ncbi:MAG: hypothetical protein AAFO95_13710 [Cyanobacteria bacterium J06600_6]
MTSNYSNLADAIRGVCEQWCQQNGYSDPFLRNGEWWAFPPSAVMPVRLKDVSSENKYGREVQIDRVSITLMPDGSFYSAN